MENKYNIYMSFMRRMRKKQQEWKFIQCLPWDTLHRKNNSQSIEISSGIEEGCAT